MLRLLRPAIGSSVRIVAPGARTTGPRGLEAPVTCSGCNCCPRCNRRRARTEVDPGSARNGGREPRPGGQWRYINRDPETGEEFAFHGVFHQATPDLTVQTNEFEGFPGIPAGLGGIAGGARPVGVPGEVEGQ